MGHLKARSAILVALILGCVAVARAQTSDRAEINGTIRDQTGAALSGVTVTLRDTKTGFERTTVTGERRSVFGRR